MDERKPFLALDIGGTHVSAALVDLAQPGLVPGTRVRRLVHSHGDAEAIVGLWAETAKRACAAAGSVAGVGIAMPGPFDYARGMGLFEGNEKFECLRGVNVRKALLERLGMGEAIALRFTNDAQCFLMGEAAAGAARGHADAVGITLGTGFGSGFMRQGEPVEAGPGVPPGGELYNLDFHGGMTEKVISARGIVGLYAGLGGGHLEGGVRALARRAKRDPIARRAFGQFGALLGEFLLPWLREFAPTVLVIGGNISRAAPLFMPTLEPLLQKAIPGMQVACSELLEDAALIGAVVMLNGHPSSERGNLP